MKRILYILSFLFTLTSTGFSHHHFTNIIGYWETTQGEHVIKILSCHSGLRVRGIRGFESGRFYKAGRRKFRDKRGNQLELKRNGSLIYRSRRNNRECLAPRPIIFERKNLYEGYWGGKRFSRNNNDRTVKYDKVKRKVQGLWEVRGDRERIVIRGTAEGLIARSKETNKKVYYIQDSYDYRSFNDNRGNSYTLINKGSLIWKDRRGRKILLYKIE